MLAWIGLVAAGMLNGTFAVPMKRTRAWTFNHLWGIFALLAMAVVPWLGVAAGVPDWREVTGHLPGVGVTALLALGLVWGGASLLYGLAIDYLGVALGTAIQLGLSIVVGALVPLFTSAQPVEAHLLPFLGSLAFMVLGVVACARAGGGVSATGARFRTGLIIAILGGLGAPLLNVGIQYGIQLLERAGTNSPSHQWVAWAMFLSAAAVTQSTVCLARVIRSGQFPTYTKTGARHDLALVLLMAVIWASSVLIYGSSAARLGTLGTSFGWPMFIGIIVVTSNAWGVLLGEWRERPPKAFRTMLAGSLILIAAVFLIAQNRPQ